MDNLKNSFKDHFSGHSSGYQKYRPSYPDKLFQYLASICPNRNTVWDCATGNGQAAIAIAPYFKNIIATDASENQILNATHCDNVLYKVASAENSGLSNHSIDLITVAQAIHWFNFDKFYDEVHRVGAKNSIVVVWGYGLNRINAEVDVVTDELYSDIIGDYWAFDRKHIENSYADIPFPFEKMNPPEFKIKISWTLEQYIGYLETWSAVADYKKKNGINPIDLVREKLEKAWGADATLNVAWAIFMKVGKVGK